MRIRKLLAATMIAGAIRDPGLENGGGTHAAAGDNPPAAGR